MQGKFVVFEGVEGSGKTTQIKRLQSWLTDSGILQQLQAAGLVSQLVVTREPGGSPLGQELRRLLLHPCTDDPIHDRTELLLYAADRAQHVEGTLKPLLSEGALILCDRYSDSTIAYQGYGRGLDRRLVDQLNQIATHNLTSDLTLWLDVNVNVGLLRAQQRGEHDRIEQATMDFHQRVQQGFTELAALYPQRIVRVDASPSEATIAAHIQSIVCQHFRQWYGWERAQC